MKYNVTGNVTEINLYHLIMELTITPEELNNRVAELEKSIQIQTTVAVNANAQLHQLLGAKQELMNQMSKTAHVPIDHELHKGLGRLQDDVADKKHQ
jgi:hypothetical protein